MIIGKIFVLLQRERRINLQRPRLIPAKLITWLFLWGCKRIVLKFEEKCEKQIGSTVTQGTVIQGADATLYEKS